MRLAPMRGHRRPAPRPILLAPHSVRQSRDAGTNLELECMPFVRGRRHFWLLSSWCGAANNLDSPRTASVRPDALSALMHFLPWNHNDPADRPAHLSDDRRGAKTVVSHGASQAQGSSQRAGLNCEHLHMRHLIGWNSKQLRIV